jgi:hypothetical protein
MKKIFFAVLLLCSVTVFGQHTFITVNRSAVEKAVGDADASTYYPKLLERFNAFDTTLTAMDYRLLYYGFAFQKEYNGYLDHKSKEMSKAIAEKRYDDAIRVCEDVLKRSPISLEANSKMGFAKFLKDKTDPSAMKYGIRYRKLVTAILDSGDGQTCKTAFKVLYVHDEYNIMTEIFKIRSIKSQALQGFCDQMTIEPSTVYPGSTLYFDTYESLANMEQMLKAKQ